MLRLRERWRNFEQRAPKLERVGAALLEPVIQFQLYDELKQTTNKRNIRTGRAHEPADCTVERCG